LASALGGHAVNRFELVSNPAPNWKGDRSMGAQRFRRDCRRRGSTPRPTNLVNPGGKPQTL